ncbi:MAG: phosphopentomutase [Trichloromonadaceae bacterium]
MSTPFRRVVLIVLDGVGIGALPDAAAYGDVGANTLGHVAEACGGLQLPNLLRLGLGHLLTLPGSVAPERVIGGYGRMLERSVGKDTTTGHWELAGLVQQRPFATYPRGFPAEIIEAFTQATGLAPLGNIAASGTDILRLLGVEHLASGRPIVYTSADSVFQIAAHEEVIPVERLYQICRQARDLLDPYRVGRVIARPFVGTAAENFRRTARRHDFSMPPGGPTILDLLVEAGMEVVGIGKIKDIFAGRGLTRAHSSDGNAEGMAQTLGALEQLQQGLVFTNLVDFDMLFGHRLDARGFGRALEEFDAWLPQLQQQLQADDLLLITADHGCDPQVSGTDHTREYVPLLLWHAGLDAGVNLGDRGGFADVAATIGEALGVAGTSGESLLRSLPGY